MRPRGARRTIGHMEIDYESARAPYEQIADEVVAAIRSGELQPGRPIPSESTMVQRYGVARDTARRAVRRLREQGWVHTVPQRGSFVRDREDWPAG